MGNVTTIGKLLLASHLPVDMHAHATTNTLDQKNIRTLFNTLSEKSPEVYGAAVTGLSRAGFEISTRLGSSIKLTDLLSPVDKKKIFLELDADIAKVKTSDKPNTTKKQEINNLYYSFSDKVNKLIVEEGVKNNQTLAKVISAGSRGSPAQYRQTVFSPLIATDAKGQVLTDFPLKRSFAEGLSLPEYLASSFGARQSVIATKLSTADAGHFSKQLTRAAMTLQVEEHDCGVDSGIPVSVKDKDSVGAYLAKPVGGYNKNNEVTPTLLNSLENKGIKTLVVRSPITCIASRKSHPGAVCQLCVGKRGKNLSPLGDYVGITAATSLGEPLSQGTLNTKHTGPAIVRGISTGFELVNQLANIPHTFKHNAPLAAHDGVVTEIRKAPQGGSYLDIQDSGSTNVREYYVSENLSVKIKKGEKVEAGDVLSEGIVNPAELVKHKGIGEGRRYYATTLKDAFDSSGMGGINRRNFELVARSAIDHVRINHHESIGGHLPDDIVSYQQVEKDYTPRVDAKRVRVDQAHGKYLEEPALHYTIGTRISRSTQSELANNGIESALVHNAAPHFEPEMQRLIDIPAFEDDWMHQLYSTNLEKRFVSAVNRGASSDIKGPSPIAGLAYGVGFSQKKAEEHYVAVIVTGEQDGECIFKHSEEGWHIPGRLFDEENPITVAQSLLQDFGFAFDKNSAEVTDVKDSSVVYVELPFSALRKVAKAKCAFEFLNLTFSDKLK